MAAMIRRLFLRRSIACAGVSVRPGKTGNGPFYYVNRKLRKPPCGRRRRTNKVFSGRKRHGAH